MGGELKDSIIFVDDVKKADGTKIDVSSTKFNPNGTMASKNYTPMSLLTILEIGFLNIMTEKYLPLPKLTQLGILVKETGRRVTP